MKFWKVILIVGLIALATLVWPGPQLVDSFFTSDETVEEVVDDVAEDVVPDLGYDSDYALAVCGDRPVDDFNPQTGIVTCAKIETTQPEGSEDDSSESDEALVPEDTDEITPVVETDDCHLMSGAEFQGWNAEGKEDDDYNISVNCDGWYWQPDLPTSAERDWHLVSISIPEGDYLFNGVSCRLYLDPDRNELGSENPLVVSYGNGLPFSVELPDDATYETAYGIVKCDDTEVTGFSIEVAP